MNQQAFLSEITIKAITKLKNQSDIELVVITDPILLKHEIKNLNNSAKLNILDNSLNFKDYKNGLINIIPIQLVGKSVPGVLNKKIRLFNKFY